MPRYQTTIPSYSPKLRVRVSLYRDYLQYCSSRTKIWSRRESQTQRMQTIVPRAVGFNWAILHIFRAQVELKCNSFIWNKQNPNFSVSKFVCDSRNCRVQFPLFLFRASLITKTISGCVSRIQDVCYFEICARASDRDDENFAFCFGAVLVI